MIIRILYIYILYYYIIIGEKPHGCDICGKCFNRKWSLEKHKNTHLKAGRKNSATAKPVNHDNVNNAAAALIRAAMTLQPNSTQQQGDRQSQYTQQQQQLQQRQHRGGVRGAYGHEAKDGMMTGGGGGVGSRLMRSSGEGTKRRNKTDAELDLERLGGENDDISDDDGTEDDEEEEEGDEEDEEEDEEFGY